jgi:hypothetical protein
MAWSPRINNGRQIGRNGLAIHEPRPDLNHKVQNHAIQKPARCWERHPLSVQRVRRPM